MGDAGGGVNLEHRPWVERDGYSRDLLQLFDAIEQFPPMASVEPAPVQRPTRVADQEFAMEPEVWLEHAAGLGPAGFRYLREKRVVVVPGAYVSWFRKEVVRGT